MRQISIFIFLSFFILITGNAFATPTITSQPVSQTVYEGQSATFTVAASSNTNLPLTYHWSILNHGSKQWKGIFGANSASYTFFTSNASNNGAQFLCVISDGSGYPVTTNWVTLSVNPAPTVCPIVPTPQPIVDVTSAPYNAVGDGKTDDTAAIQSAVNYVVNNGSGTVYIPNGVYMIDANTPSYGIQLQGNMTFQMANKAVLEVISNNSSIYHVLNVIDAPQNNVSNLIISGGTILGDKYTHSGTTGQWGMGINISGTAKTNVLVENTQSSQMWGDGFYLDSNGGNTYFCGVTANDNRRQGISVVSGSNVAINNSTFENTGYSIGTDPMSGIDIETNPPTDGGGPVNDLKIENSLFLNNMGEGISVLPYWQPITNVTIVGNNISGNFGGIELMDTSKSNNHCDDYSIADNAIYDSNKWGILLGPQDNGNIVDWNFVTVSGNASEYAIFNGPGDANTLYDNTENVTTSPPVYYQLTTSVTGNGTNAANPNLTNYLEGSTVVLKATPSAGYQFSNWSGDESGTTSPLYFMMTSNKNVIGNYTSSKN